MFPYDPALQAAARPPRTIADVLTALRAIDAACIDGDGLKWFNWLYLQVTEAVAHRVAGGGFSDPAWLSELDVQFAALYFSALRTGLQGGGPGCWRALFAVRNNTRLGRVQFALAGVNSHINHDLPQAIVATCEATGTAPVRGGAQFTDYTAVNATLDPLIQQAKTTLRVRLPGDALPPVSFLDNAIAAWGLAAARDKAWSASEVLWHIRGTPPVAAAFMDSLDGLATVASKVLLTPVP